MVNKNIESFLIEVTNNVVFNADNIDIVKEKFIKGIDENQSKCQEFANGLSAVKTSLRADLDFFMDCDPAIDSEKEVVLAYPGFKAITSYRIAHILRGLGYLLEARIISEHAHSITGIDIHPGARIDSPFFIDHGTGIVIGETTIIGKNVRLYQGVTLGALSLAKGSKMKGTKRHPTIGSNVIIYSGASILGDIKIGDNVTIGSNVFLTEDVPNDTKVRIGKPELVVTKK